MLNFLKRKKKKGTLYGWGESISIDGGDIRVIGDKASGKTTYMASLAYWPNANPASLVQSITSYGDQEAGAELIAKAQNILEQGLELEKTDLNVLEAVKDYGLSIVLKEQFSLKNVHFRPRMVKLNINCKDYAGEFFSDLIYKIGDPKLDDYLEDCKIALGILFLVDGTTHRKDAEYARGFDKFFQKLDRADLDQTKRRLAFTFSKCEQSQLWVSRHEPRELAKRRFPLVQKRLATWQEMSGGAVEYFTTSAFGTIGHNYPEPNSIQLTRNRNGTTSVIRDPKRWRPFGLVSPLYWLCTGQRHQELDKD